MLEDVDRSDVGGSVGQEHADVQALNPIWTVSGAATVFARRGR